MKLSLVKIGLACLAISWLSPAMAESGTSQKGFCHADSKANAMAKQACFEYVRGFLEGALLTDEATIEALTAQQGEAGSFASRAYKTRVGNSRAPLPVTYFANFCLPDSSVNDDVIARVIESLHQGPSNSSSLSQQVYQATKRAFPCVQSRLAGVGAESVR